VIAEWLGILRSFLTYWRPGRQAALRRLYEPLVGAEDLVFDVGAHLGDRSIAFATLGARVVAFEPQPSIARWLRRLVRRHPRVEVRPEAVGRKAGTARLAVSRRFPTVSTLSARWQERVAEGNPGFRGVHWDRSVEVEVVTLDQMIEVYGMPSFCKIDVEGHEPEVLAGLSHPLPALSLEFVSGDLSAAIRCVQQLRFMATYEFNVVLGEERAFRWKNWQAPEAVVVWLGEGADGASSGDVYARRVAGEGAE
jgi:FkbM family methyltransferase